jgi:predicted ribosomally synthesized peptide with nif11-like leader
MKMNKELLEKAKRAKNAEELIALAKENGVELSDEQAKAYFAKLNSENGELGDDELDNVAGGACCETEYHNFYNYKRLDSHNNPCEHWLCGNCKVEKDGRWTCNPYDPDVHNDGCRGCRWYVENGGVGYCTYEFEHNQK